MQWIKATRLTAGSAVLLAGLSGCARTHPNPPPPPPPAPAPPAAPRKIETLMGAHFDFDKATLRPAGKEKVQHAVQVANENPSMRIRIEGYTDSIGSDTYNTKLGQRRADAVKAYMVQLGIDPNRITTKSFGENNPVATNSTAEGRAQNRRVEILGQ